MGKYLVKPKSYKWTAAAFLYILDAAGINAATLSKLTDNITPKSHKNEFFFFDWNWQWPSFSAIRISLQNIDYCFGLVNSAEMPYTYTCTLYSGKPPGEPNEYYSTTLDDLVKYLLAKVWLIKSIWKAITYVIDSTPSSNWAIGC